MNDVIRSIRASNLSKQLSKCLVFSFEGNERSYSKKLKQVLTDTWNSGTDNRGFILTRQVTLTGWSGLGTDGSSWSHAFWGFEPNFETGGLSRIACGPHQLLLRSSNFILKKFDLFQQTVHCGCGCTKRLTALRLPQELSQEFMELNQSKEDRTRQNKVTDFVNRVCMELINQDQKYAV